MLARSLEVAQLLPPLLLLLALGALLVQYSSAFPYQDSADDSPGSVSLVPASSPDPGNSGGRKLTGRFLHITDIHPDPFYKLHSSTDGDHVCHTGKGDAGAYGAETTDCDSPYSLVNQTFAWIKDNIKDEVDFVIWTGDNARHDNDEDIPRTRDQIVEQNKFIVSKFFDVWGKSGGGDDDDDPTNDFMIPIVPALGNNDVLPHNIFLDGPNTWSRKYLNIWRQFVPEEQRHQFQEGGWFWVEVIPNKLAVVSLNTLYFFAKNAAVDGCAPKSEPGYEHFDWLRVQLEMLRVRGMKAMIMGHVPPARTESKLSWDESCWQKYALWMEQYRDVVVGSFYGHMNIDHFILQDFRDIKKSTRKGAIGEMKTTVEDDKIGVEGYKSYLIELRDIWNDMVKLAGKKGARLSKKKYHDRIGGKFAERYAVSHVSASVVPNYFPTLRVYEYNITGLEDVRIGPGSSQSSTHAVMNRKAPASLTDGTEFEEGGYDEMRRWPNEESRNKKKKKKHRKKKKKKKGKKKYKFHLPNGPSKSTPPGPAYSPQTLSLIGFTQYYANLTFINNDIDVVSEQDIGMLHTSSPVGQVPLQVGEHTSLDATSKSKPKPKPKPKPNNFTFAVEYDTQEDKLYKLKDLSVRNYVELARRMGKKRKGDLFGESDDEYDELMENDVSKDASSTYETVSIVAEEGGKSEKNKKKGKKKKKKSKMNKIWFAFVNRALVGSMDPEQIEEYFG